MIVYSLVLYSLVFLSPSKYYPKTYVSPMINVLDHKAKETSNIKNQKLDTCILTFFNFYIMNFSMVKTITLQ